MPSAVEVIGQASSTNASWIEYTSIPATYDQLLIIMRGIRVGNDNSTTGTSLACQFRINGSWCTNHGSTFMNAYHSSTNVQSQNNDTDIFLVHRFHAQTYYTNNTTGGMASVVMEVFNYHDNNSQTNDVIPYYKWQAQSPNIYFANSGDVRMMRLGGGGIGDNQSTKIPIDGFRLKSDSGNLDGGFTIYGVKYD